MLQNAGDGVSGRFVGRFMAGEFRLAAGIAVLALAVLPGCGGIDAFAPEMDDIVRPSQLKYEETDLSAPLLEERMKEIDQSYSEPRTPGKVYLSYETSVGSISKGNGYQALWRGTRACAWLAMNHSDRAQRELFALKGVSMGREAAKKASTNVESFYYLSLCLGALADLKPSPPPRDIVRELRDMIKMALALDEKFDYCGPHRVLGLLIVRSEGYPLYNVGTEEEGFQHLEKATRICPEYGENHLVYAQSLKEAGRHELARAELEKVIESMKPKDRSAEHDTWLKEANELLQDLPGS